MCARTRALIAARTRARSRLRQKSFNKVYNTSGIKTKNFCSSRWLLRYHSTIVQHESMAWHAQSEHNNKPVPTPRSPPKDMGNMTLLSCAFCLRHQSTNLRSTGLGEPHINGTYNTRAAAAAAASVTVGAKRTKKSGMPGKEFVNEPSNECNPSTGRSSCVVALGVDDVIAPTPAPDCGICIGPQEQECIVQGHLELVCRD